MSKIITFIKSTLVSFYFMKKYTIVKKTNKLEFTQISISSLQNVINDAYMGFY